MWTPLAQRCKTFPHDLLVRNLILKSFTWEGEVWDCVVFGHVCLIRVPCFLIMSLKT